MTRWGDWLSLALATTLQKPNFRDIEYRSRPTVPLSHAAFAPCSRLLPSAPTIGERGCAALTGSRRRWLRWRAAHRGSGRWASRVNRRDHRERRRREVRRACRGEEGRDRADIRGRREEDRGSRPDGRRARRQVRQAEDRGTAGRHREEGNGGGVERRRSGVRRREEDRDTGRHQEEEGDTGTSSNRQAVRQAQHRVDPLQVRRSARQAVVGEGLPVRRILPGAAADRRRHLCRGTLSSW